MAAVDGETYPGALADAKAIFEPHVDELEHTGRPVLGVIVDEVHMWGTSTATAGDEVHDYAADGRHERELAHRARRDLRDSLEATRTLFGHHLADELEQQVNRVIDCLEVSASRFERAAEVKGERIGRLEAELADRARRCTFLGREVTDQMNKLAKAEQRASRQAEKIEHLATVLAEEEAHAWAARAVLASAVRWTKRTTRKKNRPGWLASAVELLSLRDDGR